MKNITPYMLKTCIYLDSERFDEILNEVFGPDIRAEYSLDGISVFYETAEEEPDVKEKLAEYFGVSEITSIHIDDCEYIGVWICYKE